MIDSDPEIILNPVLVSKIHNYMNSSIYRETIENAAAFNSRLSADRTQRLPFLDSQTGVAQNHSALWMDERQRLPGFREGQVYTYPSKKWRKKRRQYLNGFMQPRYPSGQPRKDYVDDPEPPNNAVECTIAPAASGPSTIADEIKEVVIKEDVRPPEAWYYDDLDIPDAGEFDEPDADSDFDYEESYSKRKKKKTAAKSTRQASTRGRRKITYDAITDPEKPFSCDICGARYKTRPGLTYHYTHSHKDREDDDEDDTAASKREDSAARRQNPRSTNASLPPPVLHPQHHQHQMQQLQPPTLQPQQPPPPHHMMNMSMGSPHGGPMMSLAHMSHHHPPPHLVPQQQPPHLMQNAPSPLLPRPSSPPSMMPVISNPGPGPSMVVQANYEDQGNVVKKPLDNMKPRVQPSHYCDFCLGDAVENKKSGSPEELVSCSDCGRSGHPTCLQFTANMIISVKKYRWQCIECKCCSICGTSDNDDQLLFCDDCDRGYHMYCLSPPLEAPPEGSWSCTLCLAEFHNK